MKRTLSICFGIGTLVAIPSAYAVSTAQQIVLLEKMVKQQGRQINILSARLNKLENHPAPPPAPSTLPPGHPPPPVPPHSHVSFVRTSPSQDTVLKQAASSDDVTAIPRTRLLLGDSKANVSIVGDISAMGFHVNDGKKDYMFFGTNTVTDSRLSVNSELKPSKNWIIGSHVQLGFDVNPSNALSQTSQTQSPSIDMRRAEIYVTSKYLGTVFLGKGETASDDTAYSDLSGTKLLGRATLDDIGGGLFFRNKNTGLLSGTTVSNTINGLDGFSRQYRIRYDTPSYKGFNLATSAIADDRQDIALKFGHKLGNTKVAAQIAFTSPQYFNAGTANAAHGNELNGSASVLFPIGFSLTGALGEVMANEAGRKDPNYFYFKPGFQHKFFHAGLTATSVDMGRYFNFAQNHDAATSYGVQLLQNIDSWDLATYIGYRYFKLHRSGTPFDSMNLVMAGALYNF
jgi:hypothetical protein